MQLQGSCHCKAVRFTVHSSHPYPFNVCYCETCRKTAGSGGSAINLGAEYKSLKLEGEENVRVYKAKIQDPKDKESRQSSLERSFCSLCGSALWCWHPKWPELLHPHASAIDTPLPAPPATHAPHARIQGAVGRASRWPR